MSPLPTPITKEDTTMTTNITALKNGPFAVRGDLSELNLTDAAGNAYDYQAMEMGGQKQVFLCRCGASVKKPFCDGTHSKIGFEAAEAAVRES